MYLLVPDGWAVGWCPSVQPLIWVVRHPSEARMGVQSRLYYVIWDKTGTVMGPYKAWYTLATKLNATRSTWLKVDRCRNWQQIDNSRLLPIRSTLLPIRAYGRLCCRFWQQIGNNLNSTVCRGRLCCRYVWLCRHARVYRAKAKVDHVEFNFVANVYWAQATVKPHLLHKLHNPSLPLQHARTLPN